VLVLVCSHVLLVHAQYTAASHHCVQPISTPGVTLARSGVWLCARAARATRHTLPDADSGILCLRAVHLNPVGRR
jgi:hypothetical protein